MSAPTWSVRRVHALDDAQIGELAGVLIDCVEGGASVSFMHPCCRGAGCATRQCSTATSPVMFTTLTKETG